MIRHEEIYQPSVFLASGTSLCLEGRVVTILSSRSRAPFHLLHLLLSFRLSSPLRKYAHSVQRVFVFTWWRMSFNKTRWYGHGHKSSSEIDYWWTNRALADWEWGKRSTERSDNNNCWELISGSSKPAHPKMNECSSPIPTYYPEPEIVLGWDFVTGSTCWFSREWFYGFKGGYLNLHQIDNWSSIDNYWFFPVRKGL